MFKFKGISSNDMQVVIEEEEHFIARAARRYEVTEIEGRDGAIFNELGYSYVERPIYVQCLNTNKIDDILAWLDGEGEFEYKGRKTTARFYSQLEPQRETVIRIIDTTFIRDPFWTKLEDEFVEVKGDKEKNAEAENINLKGTIPVKFKEFKVSGNSKQDTREGKNLTNYKDFTNIDENNTIVTSKENDKITATIKTNGFGITDIERQLKPNTNYTAFCDFKFSKTFSGSYGLRVKIGENWGNTSKTGLINFSTTDIVNVRIAFYAGVPYTGEEGVLTVSNIRLYEGTYTKETIPEYEEYGAMPSPEFPSEIQNVEGDVNVTVANKNLFTGLVKGISINHTTGEEEKKNNSSASDFIKVNFYTNTGYYLSGLTNTLSSYVAFYNKDKKYLGRTGGFEQLFIYFSANSFSSMAPDYENIKDKNITFVRITQYATAVSPGTIDDIDNLQVQLETGSTSTAYVPHKQQTVTFPLATGQKLYKGDYLADDGIHHVRNQRELDGTEYWFVSGICYYISIPDKKLRYELTKGKMLCNYFKETIASNSVESKIGEFFEAFYSSGNRNVMFNYDNGEGGVDNFKSYLAAQKQAGTPVILEYELAEEEIEPYTEEQQEAYNQICNLKAYEGETNIYSTNEISPIFKVTYIEETTEKIENEGNIYSRPILRLEKTSYNNVDIEIAGTRFQYNFNDEEYVEIDCEEKTALYEGLNRNRKLEIGYEFPKLLPGENDIKMHEGDCIIKAKRKDRWL